MGKFKRLLALIFFILIGVSLSGAQSQNESWTQSCDPRLQKALEKRINALKLDGATEHKNLSIVVVDITDISDPRMAYVNPNEMMYAASLPKIAILLGAFEKIAEGEMTGSGRNRLSGRAAAIAPLPPVRSRAKRRYLGRQRVRQGPGQETRPSPQSFPRRHGPAGGALLLPAGNRPAGITATEPTDESNSGGNRNRAQICQRA